MVGWLLIFSDADAGGDAAAAPRPFTFMSINGFQIRTNGLRANIITQTGDHFEIRLGLPNDEVLQSTRTVGQEIRVRIGEGRDRRRWLHWVRIAVPNAIPVGDVHVVQRRREVVITWP